MNLDLEQRQDGMYSGTFRWTEHKQFPALPTRTAPASMSSLTGGWQGYLSGSHEMNLIPWATTDPSFLDALSFPMTYIYINTILSRRNVSTILIIGATVKAEQRVWCNTSYWNEIAAFYPDQAIQMWFIGPEVLVDCAPKHESKLSVSSYCGTIGDFLSSHSVDVETTIMIGYNTGFGNFVESNRYDLLWSWLPDLYTIAASGILTIFAYMNGEFAIHTKVLGSNFVYLPKDNPFSAASHLHEEGKQNTSWSRANSFVYAIQGYDLKRQQRIAPGDIKHLNKLLEMDVDLHLTDHLGRHYYRGMILSKEQAAKSKVLSQSTNNATNVPTKSNKVVNPKVNQPIQDKAMSKNIQAATSTKENATKLPDKSIDSNANHPMDKDKAIPKDGQAIITPKYQLISSLNNTKMKIIIQTPALTSTKAMDLQVSNDQLLLTVPGLYHLYLELPWQVDNAKTIPKYSKKDKVVTIILEV
ncbi:hypothetical protein THRCLA_10971 [Thraustotheca clavata]|uniref:Uncharacterized protein n=1 Tax=Thraustotheca clavata TaxID=74557 RepID=A0A1V9YC36_9STRA|nr:hypothetical protein THRCLA_10971 [Thraustotheca clavata]